MSGHSKWSTIKRKKAVTDSKRGKVFTRCLKEVQVAAKMGGGSLDANPRLKTAVQSAKAQSVPNDNIEKAIKRGTGDIEGVEYEEILYEGYGHAGVAILIKTLTDNRNRTVAEVRHALGKYGGSMASANAVAYLFQDKGVLSISTAEVSEEDIYDLMLEAGAEDISNEGDVWEILTAFSDFQTVREALETLGKDFEAEIRSIPDTMVKVAGKEAESLMKLMDALDDLDDVQSVTANFDIDEDELERLSN